MTDDPRRAETAPQLIRAMSVAYGDRVAVVKDHDALTYRQLDERSAVLARGLLRRGVGKGTPIGLIAGNSPEWVVWWAAISRIGALCVPLSTFLRPAELSRLIRHADLNGLVVTPTFLDQSFIAHLETEFPELLHASGELVLPGAPYLRWVMTLAPDPVREWAHAPAWLDAPEDSWDRLLRATESEVHVDDELISIYTSGQSASPKAVVHTHRSVLSKVHYLREMLQYDQSIVIDAVMPFFWIGGLVMALFTTLEVGGTVRCVDRSSFPPMTPSSPNPFEHLPVFPAMGMTETFGMYAWGREWRAPGSQICPPLDVFQPGFDVKVVDAEGRAVVDGEEGQIVVRGPSVAVRLHKVQQDECFDRDGFYRTGDGGRVEGDRIHFTGRLGDMIKTSGANVSPAEVQLEIEAMDGVIAAHVVGLPDDRRGELVAAAVVVDGSVPLDAEAICAHLQTRLSTYKVPRKIAVFDSSDEIPMTPTMKVHRPALVELLARVDEVRPRAHVVTHEGSRSKGGAA